MLLVSIIIPTYNQESLVLNAINSCIKQSYFNIQIVILDDASSDNTEKIISPYLLEHKNIEYFKNEQNIGRVKTYHRALYELVKGDFCVVLDGDDYFTDENFISQAVESIMQYDHRNVLFFQASNYSVKADNIESFKFTTEKFIIKLYDAIFYFKKFNTIGFSHLTTIYNRDLALKNNFYTADIFSSDIDSILRLCLKHPNFIVLKTNAKVAVWLKHSSNTSSSKSFKKLWPSLKIYFSMAKHENANKIGTNFFWVVKQITKPLLSVLLRKLKLI
jgi:glycosyltransferase involved in cell wall biosynthesis